ncbi:Uncharacterized protein TPAR_02554 [Tolypocladium paradoxum]|uniref:Uncharacterized protein n=1 Tax=Tolypocladium paradoxum TaxID=94208 RepID=A0A2S4L488_9HYPO|nr:Uncharacterized protein TPAR_02554 [Tolypocladium paradoxum]
MPVQPINPNARKRPGPPPIDFSKRQRKATAPIKRAERSYSETTRANVLIFLERPYKYDPCSLKADSNGWRPPTFVEAASHFKIPATTIKTWAKARRVGSKPKFVRP